jgi:hypothetical protein
MTESEIWGELRSGQIPNNLEKMLKMYIEITLTALSVTSYNATRHKIQFDIITEFSSTECRQN